jgi:hypothetical protein
MAKETHVTKDGRTVKKGYYNKWPQDYYDGTVNKRKTYRRYRL